MTQFFLGRIRHLRGEEKPGDRLDDLTTLVGKEYSGRTITPTEYRRQMNIRVQSAAADIVTRLITADIIQSQRWDQVDEIVREVLFEAFIRPRPPLGGPDNPPQSVRKS